MSAGRESPSTTQSQLKETTPPAGQHHSPEQLQLQQQQLPQQLHELQQEQKQQHLNGQTMAEFPRNANMTLQPHQQPQQQQPPPQPQHNGSSSQAHDTFYGSFVPATAPVSMPLPGQGVVGQPQFSFQQPQQGPYATVALQLMIQGVQGVQGGPGAKEGGQGIEGTGGVVITPLPIVSGVSMPIPGMQSSSSPLSSSSSTTSSVSMPFLGFPTRTVSAVGESNIPIGMSATLPTTFLPPTPSSLSSTTTSIGTTTTSTTATNTATRNQSAIISLATVDALGGLLEVAATVKSIPSHQEQRRRETYKSGSLIHKSLKKSQEERRKQALEDQAKKRNEFTNHARRLALFSATKGEESEEESEEGDGDEEGDDDDDDEDEDEDQDDMDEDDEDDDDEASNSKDLSAASNSKDNKKKSGTKRKNVLAQDHQQSTSSTGSAVAKSANTGVIHDRDKDPQSSVLKQKRRLSSASEDSDSSRPGNQIGGGSGSQTGTGNGSKDKSDHLSPKKRKLKQTAAAKKRAQKRDKPNPYRDQLMLAEPLTDIPPDFDSSYYIVPLPVGHRCFVISADGKTQARLASGQLLVAAFESCLPAGASNYRGNRRTDYCILDCIYSTTTRTFWTLDIMCWRGHPVYSCETEFRFWWLRGKLAEIESLQATWMVTQRKGYEAELQKKQKMLKQEQLGKIKIENINGKKGLQQAVSTGSRKPLESMHQSGSKKNGNLVSASTPTTATTTSSSSLPSSSAAKPVPKTLTSNGRDPDLEMSSTAATEEDVSMSIDQESSSSLSSQQQQQQQQHVHEQQQQQKQQQPRPFQPISFTPLPYFNATLNMVRLLAESMNPRHLNLTVSAQPPTSSTLSTALQTQASDQQPPLQNLGTMALSGEIADAAGLFPAHDRDQRIRQEKLLGCEQASGLVFFNKKTMYVMGLTPLCGYVGMDQIGDVFFDEEGGVGPAPGTSAVEGREIEMEDALERIRI